MRKRAVDRARGDPERGGKSVDACPARFKIGARLRARIRLWADEEVATDALPPEAGPVLDAILYHGDLPRREVADVLGVSDGTARGVVAALADHGVIRFDTPKGPLHIAFPEKLASRCMPGLFPEKTS